MKCSNVIVPGFEETSKIKNPGLETKIDRDIEERMKKHPQRGYTPPSYLYGIHQQSQS